VRASPWLTRGEAWGSFLEARTNAAERYRAEAPRERRWARRARGAFSVFLASSTDPFVPEERRLGITKRVLEAMCEEPPDELVVQTHTHRVADYLDLYPRLAAAGCASTSRSRATATACPISRRRRAPSRAGSRPQPRSAPRGCAWW
jgi:DNA repair photolyase